MKSPVAAVLYDPREQPMKYLWLKYVEGVNLAEHCQKSLLGPGSRRIGTRHIAGRRGPVEFANVPLDEFTPRVYYLCGVSDPYDLRTNFHLAFAYEPGAKIEVHKPGIHALIQDARQLPITPHHIDPAHPRAKAYMWRTCRNWQFAWSFHVGAYDRFVVEPEPVAEQTGLW